MKHILNATIKYIFSLIILSAFINEAFGQYKTFEISNLGDTLNAIDQQNKKQGKWVVKVAPLRGERGYEEEGIYLDDKKEGNWRKYTTTGDFIALENYFKGGKDGICQYFSALGALIREESWRAYNPNSPYDTIAIYGAGNNEIISYKVVKAEPYSVKNGTWTYFDGETGRIMKTEEYDLNRLVGSPKTETVLDEPMKKIKPAEVLEYEKKNSGKKKVKVRDGRTGT